ncbi:MAG: PQQ-like beta-propeller repeat protein [Planctomycetales bacterium]|nr:PQQ-like beta-propeller repeat protein [Planctomycetales bacterium]
MVRRYRKLNSVVVAHLVLLVAARVNAQDWPNWRGPNGTGSVSNTHGNQRAPVTWGAEKNIAWRAELVGRGHSTPVVSGPYVFVTSAVSIGKPLPPHMSGRPGEHDNLPVTSEMQFVVICISRENGRIIWQKVVHQAIPVEGAHVSASLASHSPVVDQNHVYAMFGSHGLYCLDFQGELIWEKQFGQMHSKHGHGEGASPAIDGNTLVVNWDHEEQSFIVALDKRTGNEIWRRDRDEVTSWSSPIIVNVDGQLQVIVCGTNRVRGYELETGDVLWECGGLSSNIVASPVYDAQTGILVVGSSYEIRFMAALRLPGASGDISGTERVLWSRTRGTPYVPSFLMVNDGVYFLAHYQNILTRVRITDGREEPGPMRLGALGNIYASPVSDGIHVYITDLHGVTQVITADESPKAVSVNELGENVCASLAMADGSIFIRGEKHLFKVSE